MEGKIYADINPDHFERERATMPDDEISAPERPDESEKTSETNMGSLSEQEIEDLQWPTVRKGWSTYWRKRLGSQSTRLLKKEADQVFNTIRDKAKSIGVVNKKIENLLTKKQQKQFKNNPGGPERLRFDEVSMAERKEPEQQNQEGHTGSFSHEELEDLSWPSSRKGWVRYWRVRLNRDASFDEIRTIIRELHERAEREGVKGDNTWRKIREQKKKEKKRRQKMNRDQQSEVVKIEDLTRIDDPVVQNEGRILEDSIEHISQTNEIILEQPLPNVASQQEKRDLAMTTSAKGWPAYWLKRLATELDILPRSIKNIVETYIRTNQFKGSQKLQRYVNERIRSGGKKNDNSIRSSLSETKTSNIQEGSISSKLKQYVARRVDILQFQVDKRAQMARLKEELRRIDAQEDLPDKEKEKRRVVSYEDETKMLFVVKNSSKKVITIGDIVGDLEWGIKYYPDASVPHILWRKIRKLSALREARVGVEEIFNREISQTERISLPTTTLTVDYIEKHLKDFAAIYGVIAERMIQSKLTRIQYNHPELNLRVEHSNALEDAELKYDFKLVVPIKIRGVGIEGSDMSRDQYVQSKKKLGVQFTTSKRVNRKKREGVESAKSKISETKYLQYVKRPVDDIVIVNINLSSYTICFKEWLQNGKPSGGPEQYLLPEEKKYFLKIALNGLVDLSDEEIEQLASE